GIRKGNVGTEWQNIAYRHLPEDLMQMMRSWAEEAGKDIKFATKQFYGEIDDIPAKNRQAIEDDARRTAVEYFKAFRAVGSASTLAAKF
ncbi:MAG: fructose-bisphosphate aldolase, partial [candidate division Zixibacteria bacterium]